MPQNERTPKRVLEHVLYQIIEFKKLNQEEDEEEEGEYMHENAQIFHDVEEPNYFDDLDEYDDLDQWQSKIKLL